MDSHLGTWSLAGRTVWERLEDVDLFGASKLLLFQDLLSFMVSIGISLSLHLFLLLMILVQYVTSQVFLHSANMDSNPLKSQAN